MIDWIARWQNGQIGFHKSELNSRLQAHLGACALPQGARILVPLCGKSVDMMHFATLGYTVVGVELSELAVEAFFTEQELSYTKAGNVFTAVDQPIRLYAKSIFELTSDEVGDIDLIYDRAALAALEPKVREQYAQHLMSITNNAPQLLLVLNYHQDLMSGPPFAVSTQVVEQLYSSYRITQLESYNDIAHEDKFASHGLMELYKESYLLQ